MDYTPRIVGEGLAKINVAPLHLRVPYSLAQLSCHTAVLVQRKLESDPLAFLYGLIFNTHHLAAGYVPPGLRDLLGVKWCDDYSAIEEEALKEVLLDLKLPHPILPKYLKVIPECHEIALATAVRDFSHLKFEEHELTENADPNVRALRILAWHEAANHWVHSFDVYYKIFEQIYEKSQKPCNRND